MNGVGGQYKLQQILAYFMPKDQMFASKLFHGSEVTFQI